MIVYSIECSLFLDVSSECFVAVCGHASTFNVQFLGHRQSYLFLFSMVFYLEFPLLLPCRVSQQNTGHVMNNSVDKYHEK